MECPACQLPNADGARFCAKCGALLPASNTQESDPLIGTIVGGRFRITGILGEGGMGRVYTGEQQMGTSVRKVAVKTLLAQYAKDPQVLARFMRECGTVSELEHPNTIKVYDFGQTDTRELYIAMELLTGVSLEKALEPGPIAAERAEKILGQISGSLQEAHGKGIVHRDLKPANIYLTTRAGEDDYVKVLDFGIAKRDDKHSKHEQKLTQQGTVLGTPPYMSPEQFKGHELDARSDIYSLGVMTYEMLTGRLPFDADTPWAWATQHMTAQPFPFETIPMAAHVPPKMKAAVMRALSKDKERRQQSAREFFEEFATGARNTVTGMGTAVLPSGQQHPSQVPPYSQESMGLSVPSDPSHPMHPSSRPFAAPSVPTGSGQVFAPPPAPPRKGSNSILVAALAVLGVISAVGIVVYVSRPGPDARNTGKADDGRPQTGSDTPGKTADPPPNTAGQGTADHPRHDPTGKNTTTIGISIDECARAIEHAKSGNVTAAVKDFRKGCKGTSKEEKARTAIDAAGRRAAEAGCMGFQNAKAAASIGARSGMELLRNKHCHKGL